MRIVAALGGNALLRRGDKPDADTQIRNVQTAAAQLAALAADHEPTATAPRSASWPCSPPTTSA